MSIETPQPSISERPGGAQRLEGKVAIVTGAASGIGRSVALRFAAEGADVIVADIGEQGGSETARLITDGEGEGTYLSHDVTSEESWRSLVERTVDRHGGVDVLVNNAGIYVIGSLAETTVEEWERLMAINVTGVFLGMKHAAPAIAGRGGGSIINLSSVAGLLGAAGHTLYGASKGAVRIMTKDAAIELAPAKVRVNSVHPGYVNTGMARYGADTLGTTVEQLGGMYPLGRIGEPGDVANAILFLASDESSYVTGSELVIDGGGSASLGLPT